MASDASLKLHDDSRIGVIGGGPAGAFFSYFLLEMVQAVGLRVHLDLYEPRDFSEPGPRGCNMCGGVVSESLVQSLEGEGIHLGPDVIQRSIDSYFLHMDGCRVQIATPLQEKRLATVHRGGGPRGIKANIRGGLDGYLLQRAIQQGAHWIRARVDKFDWDDGRPHLRTQSDQQSTYDLVVVAVGVNAPTLKLFESAGIPYRGPRTTKTCLCEFCFSRDLIRRNLGNSVHVFLLNIPRLEFAALIPKGDYVTLCMLGADIDRELVRAFIDRREVREVLPPDWQPPDDFCFCSPKISLSSAIRPFSNRIVFVGDCGTTRLYKDGIGAAYRTAKAAAGTVVFHGFTTEAFQQHYWPICQKIRNDNVLGKTLFAVTRQIQRHRFARRGLWRMVCKEQGRALGPTRMSTVLWDTFTGSAPYGSVLLRTFHPAFLGRFAREMLFPVHHVWLQKKREDVMKSSSLGGVYHDGEVICRQGELGECMYVIQEGEVEVTRRESDKEFCLGILKAGDFWGEAGLLDREHVRTMTARAIGDVCVLSIEKRTFLTHIREDPLFAIKIMRRMSRRIQELESTLVRTVDPAFKGSAVNPSNK
ncbi:MAG: cyclic nucleotide-binding domain-containing protein [Acidobacteriia bacterium]|nr:cyclic nucleotide-binding domain-containing protein [Terriglobia bacterium]